MNWPLVIELAGPPQGKGRPIFHRFTSKKTGLPAVAAVTPMKTRTYEDTLRKAGQDAMDGADPYDGPLAVNVIASFPIPASTTKKALAAIARGELRPTKKPDADNLLKCLDSLNEVVWRDDKQIVSATIEKVYSSRPALRIEINLVRPNAAFTAPSEIAA